MIMMIIIIINQSFVKRFSDGCAPGWCLGGACCAHGDSCALMIKGYLLRNASLAIAKPAPHAHAVDSIEAAELKRAPFTCVVCTAHHRAHAAEYTQGK